MKKILFFPLLFICISIIIGCSDEKKSSDENVTIVIDSIDSVKADSLVTDSLLSDSIKKDSIKTDSLKADSLICDSTADTIATDSSQFINQVKKEDELKGVGISKWMIGVISFILGIIFTLCTIHLLKLIKNKKKSEQSNSPVIQAEEISEVDKNDEILRDFIIEK